MSKTSLSRTDRKAADGVNVLLSDASLLDLLDALVDEKGRVAATEALGMNSRTLGACWLRRVLTLGLRWQ